jgi:hypothetical protein
VPFDFLDEYDEKPPPIDILYEQKCLNQLIAKHEGKRLFLEWDDTEKCIVLGEAKFARYCNFKSRMSWLNTVMTDNGVSGLPSHPKWRMKSMSAVLGGSPAQLYKWFCQMQYKHFVVLYKDLLSKIAFQRGRIDCKRLELIGMHEPILRQACADKQLNILPILMETGKTPKELKKELGNTWKVLCHNSLNKNKAVAKTFSTLGRGATSVLGFLAAQPTTVLEVYGRDGALVVSHVAAHYKGAWNKYDQKIGRQLHDAKMLAEQLDKPFDALWSPRRMKEEHDSMSKELFARKFSPIKLTILDDVPVKVLEHEGYVATLLDSRALVAEEGNAMGHCVAGYAESVADGRYLVYSVTKDGQRSSTLGITIRDRKADGKTYYFMSQHHGRYNRRLEDRHESDLGELIVKQLNGENV